MSAEKTFYPGFDIRPTTRPLGFVYGPGVFGPPVENRSLDSIRKSLRNPDCDGPEIVYSIAMDVGKDEHLPLLKKLHLLYGAVTYAPGRLGEEPVRSQGHIHKPSPRNGWSTPEVYEIWSGKAIIYMQETAQDDPGRCFAVVAGPGDVVIVPPKWAHATINADPVQPMSFGAWCDRDYGFVYDDVRAHNGLAWFPVVKSDGEIGWQRNTKYNHSELVIKTPGDYSAFNIEKGKTIYTQFEEDNSRFLFVPDPVFKEREWDDYVP
jgi:glucose-6-phosphate isomerase, archaeal